MQLENLLLSSLSPSDMHDLNPHLELQKLDQQDVLFESGSEIGFVYFPTSCIISLVVTLATGEMIEGAMVGRDGVVGASACLDGRISLSRAIVQLGGSAFRCELNGLKKLALSKPHVLSLLIRHEQTVFAQAQQSAACNAVHSVEARLARWLLRARDLATTDALPFTQDFLAEMLGVARTTVSLVAHTLQQAGLIRYSRGRIQILNVDGLKESACECHETIRTHYAKLLGSNHP